jgi:hypothetical protein
MSCGPAPLGRLLGCGLLVMMLCAACTENSPQDTEWVQRASMSIARSEIPAAVVETTIYVPGGLVSSAQGVGVAASVERYRTGIDIWDSVADLPAPRHHAMSVAFDGRVYLLGGFGDGFTPWATAWALDPEADVWRDLADLPIAIGAGAAVEIDGLIYVVGGVPNGTSVYVYDPAADAWDDLPPLSQPREHIAAVAFAGDLWVLGGRWQEEMLSSVEIFDIDAGAWSEGPAMQVARSGFGATVAGDTIYVAGGEVFDFSDGFVATALDSVERFGGAAWTVATPLPRRLHGVPLVTVDETIYLLSGSIEAAAADNTGEVWSLQP